MKIYIVYGGPSSENEVSKKSKEHFLTLLRSKKPVMVEWNRDKTFTDQKGNKNYAFDEFLTKVKEENAVFVNAMHGEYCEDGWIQERLEQKGIRFTGPSSIAAALSMDKMASQRKVATIGEGHIRIIPTVRIKVTEEARPTSTEISEEAAALGEYPLFIKPNAKGSSVNSFRVENPGQLDDILMTMPTDDYVLQKLVLGTEISIGTVLDRGQYLDLPLTEIIPKGRFFDYDSKYAQGGSEEITPARLDDELTGRIKDLSVKIHNLLDLGCYSRTDMIITDKGEIYYLETNSLPGMTATSLLPQQLEYAGYGESFGEILLRNLN